MFKLQAQNNSSFPSILAVVVQEESEILEIHTFVQVLVPGRFKMIQMHSSYKASIIYTYIYICQNDPKHNEEKSQMWG